MHDSAYKAAKLFFDTYCARLGNISVVEIGSQNVNGSLKDHITPNVVEYVGVDFAAGNGVDVVLSDPFVYPFADNTFDVLITSSCFEHSSMFWLTFMECLRILKPTGIMYCSAPSVWPYHAWPVDCWRFNPDAGQGLETWGRYNKIPVKMLETYIYNANVNEGGWVDWNSVFIKDQAYENLHPSRMLTKLVNDTRVSFPKINQ